MIGRDPDSSTVTLGADDGLGATSRRTVDVLDVADYPVGSRTPLLLDPADPGWQRLVAEPDDQTGWLSLAYAVWGFGALLVGARAFSNRRRVRLLRHPCPTVTVDVLETADGCYLAVPGTGHVVALWHPLDHGRAGPLEEGLELAWDPDDPDDADDSDDVEEFGRVWRGDVPAPEVEGFPDLRSPAVVVGDLRHAGWVALLTDHGTRLPARGLQVHRSPQHGDPDLDSPEGDRPEPSALPGRPPAVDALLLDDALPQQLGRGPFARPLGRLAVAVVLLAAPVLVLALADSWYQRGMVALLGGQALVAATRLAHDGLVLTREGVTLTDGWSVLTVPWERLHGARCEGPRVLLAWGAGDGVTTGPFRLSGDALRFLSKEQSADQVATLLSTLRVRALAAGSAARDLSRRRGPFWSLLPPYLVLCVIAAVLAR